MKRKKGKKKKRKKESKATYSLTTLLDDVPSGGKEPIPCHPSRLKWVLFSHDRGLGHLSVTASKARKVTGYDIDYSEASQQVNQ